MLVAPWASIQDWVSLIGLKRSNPIDFCSILSGVALNGAEFISLSAGIDRGLLAPTDMLSPGDVCFGDKSAGCCGARHCERIMGDEGHPSAVTRTLITADGSPHTQFTLSLAPLAAIRGMPTQQVPVLLKTLRISLCPAQERCAEDLVTIMALDIGGR